MGRRSTIDLLPEKEKKQLIELLNNPKVTQAQVAELVNSLSGKKVVSRSAVNRYAQKMEAFSKKNKEARAVAEMLSSQMSNGQGNVLGKVAIEQARIIIFELFTAVDEIQKSASDPQQLMNISNGVYKLVRAVNELEQASETNINLEQKIKAKAEETAEDVAKTVASAGLSDATVELVKKKIMGIV